MNENVSPPAPPAPPEETSKSKSHRDSTPNSIFLVSYPKIVFMYPSFIMGFIAAVFETFAGFEGNSSAILGMLFLGLFAMNVLVITFDFPRTTSLTVVFGVIVLVLGTYVMSLSFPGLLPSLSGLLMNIKPVANATFYWCYTAILGIMYILVLISVQFDYWEVRPNELLHHHGFLSDLERFAAPNLKVNKEINDVFEYMLLRSGRLILQPRNEKRAIVLDNIFFIGTKEQRLTRMLGALQVQVRHDDEDDV